MVVTFCSGSLEKHGTMVHRFLVDHFRITEPICASLGSTQKDVLHFFADLRDAGLSHNFSTLAFDGDQLVAISLNSVKEIKDEHKEPQLDDAKNEYGQVISQGPYKSQNANRMCTFVETLEKDMDGLFDTSGYILKIDILCVRSDYQRKGIARTLVTKAFETALQAGCQWVGASATAVASQSLFHQMGFRPIRELPFSCFLENGISVFREVPDGGSSGKLMIYQIGEKEDK